MFFIFRGGGGRLEPIPSKTDVFIVILVPWLSSSNDFAFSLFKTFLFTYFHACVSHEIVTGIKETGLESVIIRMHAAAGEVHS